jgi:ketosteroid isomerase-like protein
MMEERPMNRFATAVLIAWGWMGVVSASPPPGTAKDSSDVAALKQLGQDMGDAMVAGDVDKLAGMFADDWFSIGTSGKSTNKEALLASFKAGKCKLMSFELGPIDVQVVGNTAAVHGSVTEKRCGDDSSGQFMYMDLLEKRGDRWMVVRSAALKVK